MVHLTQGLHRYTPTLQYYDYAKVIHSASTVRVGFTELYIITVRVLSVGGALRNFTAGRSNKLTAVALATLAVGRTYRQLKNLRNKYTNKEVQLMALLERYYD